MQGLRSELTAVRAVAGVGRTGYINVAPNNYPFYSEEERYVPIMQADGGQLSGIHVRMHTQHEGRQD